MCLSRLVVDRQAAVTRRENVSTYPCSGLARCKTLSTQKRWAEEEADAYTMRCIFVSGIPRKKPSSKTADRAHAQPVSTVRRMRRFTMRPLRSNAFVRCLTLYNYGLVSASRLRVMETGRTR